MINLEFHIKGQNSLMDNKVKLKIIIVFIGIMVGILSGGFLLQIVDKKLESIYSFKQIKIWEEYKSLDSQLGLETHLIFPFLVELNGFKATFIVQVLMPNNGSNSRRINSIESVLKSNGWHGENGAYQKYIDNIPYRLDIKELDEYKVELIYYY